MGPRMCEGTDRSVTDVSPVLPANLMLFRSRLEEQWRTTVDQVQGIGVVIKSMADKEPGAGVLTLIETLFSLSRTSPVVFVQQLERSPPAVVNLVKLLLALAVSELMYRVNLDEVLDGSDADQMGGESGRDTR